jgi:GntR family transcriptional regulator
MRSCALSEKQTWTGVATKWAWRMTGISSTQKFVLLALAKRADDDGEDSFPFLSTIAQDCCLAKRTARDAITALIGFELVVKEPRYRGDGSNTSNHYRLNLNKTRVGNVVDFPTGGKRQQGGVGKSTAGGGETDDSPLSLPLANQV